MLCECTCVRAVWIALGRGVMPVGRRVSGVVFVRGLARVGVLCLLPWCCVLRRVFVAAGACGVVVRLERIAKQ